MGSQPSTLNTQKLRGGGAIGGKGYRGQVDVAKYLAFFKGGRSIFSKAKGREKGGYISTNTAVRFPRRAGGIGVTASMGKFDPKQTGGSPSA